MHLGLITDPGVGTVVYLGSITAALVGARALLRRSKAGVGSFFAAMIGYAITAVTLAVLCASDGFHVLSLCAWGCFLGGFVGLAMAAFYAKRRNLKVLEAFSTIGAVGLVLIAVDAFVIEPHWLEVKQVHIKSPKVKNKLVIGIISDIQTDHVSTYEKYVLSTVLNEKPDLILLPGDFIQQAPPQRWREMQAMHDLLAELKFSAPNGTYAVQGNAEDPSWPSIFKSLPVKTFVASDSVHAREDVDVYGLSFSDSFNTKLKLKAAAPEKYSIVFGHGPDYSLGDVKADLLVAGHTHGGQVQLPSFGPLMTLSKVERNVGAGGLFDLGNGSRMIVTKGAGMERSNAPRLRFFCRPEVVIATIEPEAIFSKGSPAPHVTKHANTEPLLSKSNQDDSSSIP